MDGIDDITAKLSSLLDSPEGMERVKAMADSIFGSGQNSEPADTSSIFGGLGAGELETVMSLAKLLGSDTEDSRATLLRALKPHLSSERQDKVDRAVKLLRIASILPLISKQGLL